MIFVIFSRFFKSTKNKGKLNLTKYIGCEMPENVPKALDQIISNLLTWNIAQRRSSSRARLVIKEIGCNTSSEDFQSHGNKQAYDISHL